jgi:hypothetical protein
VGEKKNSQNSESSRLKNQFPNQDRHFNSISKFQPHTSPIYVLLNDYIIVNNEWERMWKKKVTA